MFPAVRTFWVVTCGSSKSGPVWVVSETTNRELDSRAYSMRLVDSVPASEVGPEVRTENANTYASNGARPSRSGTGTTGSGAVDVVDPAVVVVASVVVVAPGTAVVDPVADVVVIRGLPPLELQAATMSEATITVRSLRSMVASSLVVQCTCWIPSQRRDAGHRGGRHQNAGSEGRCPNDNDGVEDGPGGEPETLERKDGNECPRQECAQSETGDGGKGTVACEETDHHRGAHPQGPEDGQVPASQPGESPQDRGEDDRRRNRKRPRSGAAEAEDRVPLVDGIDHFAAADHRQGVAEAVADGQRPAAGNDEQGHVGSPTEKILGRRQRHPSLVVHVRACGEHADHREVAPP